MSNIIYGQPIMMGGGSGLNIAYGTTPPDDTTKLWVPLAKRPDNVEISGDSLQNAVDAIQTMVEKFPTPLTWNASAAINGKAYIFGGWTTAATTAQSDAVYEYDPVTDIIVKKAAKLAEATVGMSAVAINGKAYIFGGYHDLNDIIQEYDPATDTITTKETTLLHSGYGTAAVAIGGKAYIFGGHSGGSTTTAYREYIQEYDPTTDTIVDKTAVLSEKLHSMSAAVINGKAYIFGGSDKDGDAVAYIQEYDPNTDTITTKAAVLPNVCKWSAAVAINGKAYIFGGRNSASGYYDDIIEYDPGTDTVTTKTATLLDAMYRMSAVVIDDTAYIFAGANGDTRYQTVQAYTPKAYLGANHLKVFASVYRSGDHQVVTNIVNGKKEQLKLYMTSAFLGDEDGYAKAQDAYVYDEANSEWQALDGTSMTTDMLNALAELGVT